jgi:L-2-hydroxyglutarate oxidase LhgO
MYYRLVPDRRSLVRGLVYPVPEPCFPFLGVHLTRTVHSEVLVGPNAVLGLAREAYRAAGVSLPDVTATLGWPGFYRLARRDRVCAKWSERRPHRWRSPHTSCRGC